jgi:hypothetical protein
MTNTFTETLTKAAEVLQVFGTRDAHKRVLDAVSVELVSMWNAQLGDLAHLNEAISNFVDAIAELIAAGILILSADPHGLLIVLPTEIAIDVVTGVEHARGGAFHASE